MQEIVLLLVDFVAVTRVDNLFALVRGCESICFEYFSIEIEIEIETEVRVRSKKKLGTP